MLGCNSRFSQGSHWNSAPIVPLYSRPNGFALEAAVAIDKDMHGYARDCVRLAGMTDDPAIRKPLLKMAREWLEAAEQPQEDLSAGDTQERE
jgi:hypothetical protein